jgi:hypothetical protein
MMVFRVILRSAWRGHAAGASVTVNLNTAFALIEAGIARWE